MVRSTGALSAEKSLTGPTGDSLSSVVRRNSGNNAKRISGAESRAATKAVPSASRAPRNERRVSEAEFNVGLCEEALSRPPAPWFIESPLKNSDCSMSRAKRDLPCLTLWKRPYVSHQRLDRIRRKLFSKCRHLAFAVRNDASKIGVR